jgi:spermidine synthase
LQSRVFLWAAVLIGGISSLGIELTASRLLQPFFGSSQLIWANVIGLTLIYLTVGYMLGGRLADRWPDARLLSLLLLVAGLATALIPLLARPILQWSVAAFTSYSASIFLGSLFGVLLLFSVPIILLGMVSPFAIRLRVQDVATAGNTAGSIYALSTVGSIIGTFLPVLILIPQLGASQTFYVFALGLVLLGVAGLRRSIALAAIPVVMLLGAWQLGEHGIRQPFCEGCEAVYEQESAYNYIQVARNNRGPEGSEQIALILNEGQAFHSVYNRRYAETGDPIDLITGGTWEFFSITPFVYPEQSKSNINSLLMIGSAAGTIPKQFLAFYDADVHIDAVEIDPAIIELGREYFAMEDQLLPNYRVFAKDGRVFLSRSYNTYDVIGMDAYHQPYIPFHLTTVEFFAEVKQRLSERGVAVVNAGKAGTDYRLVNVLASTMREVFPQVFILDVPTGGNCIIIGVNRPVGDGVRNFVANKARMDDPVLSSVMEQALAAHELKLPLREWTAEDAQAWRPFTDDWAPVESMIDRMILGAVEGER